MSNRSRLLWRCRRGIREMDILFQRFMDECYPSLDEEKKQLFELFLDEADLDILNWIMNRSSPDNHRYDKIIKLFQTIT